MEKIAECVTIAGFLKRITDDFTRPHRRGGNRCAPHPMSRQLLLDVFPSPAATLNNYLPGPNTEALAAARALAPGRAIYFWGPPGCGRTHLLRALAYAPDVPAGRYLGAGEPDTATELRRLAEAPVNADMPRLVAVDDVPRMSQTEQSALFALYNRWRESASAGRSFALAVAGERAPMASTLREDLRTRLGWDLVFRLTPLADADKLAALQVQASERGLSIAPEVLHWVLTRHSRDMRWLSGLLDALDRYSLAARRPITIPLLRAMLADSDSPTP